MTRLDELSLAGVKEFRSLVARCVICFVAVALRVCGKLWGAGKGRIGWDDFWIVLGLCCNFVHAGLTFWGNICFMI